MVKVQLSINNFQTESDFDGILIALAINNWNESRINTSKPQDYLIRGKNDLEKHLYFLMLHIKIMILYLRI